MLGALRGAAPALCSGCCTLKKEQASVNSVLPSVYWRAFFKTVYWLAWIFLYKKSPVLPSHLLLGLTVFLCYSGVRTAGGSRALSCFPLGCSWRRGSRCPSVSPWWSSLDLEQLLKSINSHLSSRLRKLCCCELKVGLGMGGGCSALGTWHIYCVKLGRIIFNHRNNYLLVVKLVGGMCFATSFWQKCSIRLSCSFCCQLLYIECLGRVESILKLAKAYSSYSSLHVLKNATHIYVYVSSVRSQLIIVDFSSVPEISIYFVKDEEK